MELLNLAILEVSCFAAILRSRMFPLITEAFPCSNYKTYRTRKYGNHKEENLKEKHERPK